MLKKILSYGFVEGFAKGLNKLTLLALPFLLTTVDYGKVGLIISLEMLLPFLSLLGFERAVLRFYSQKTDFRFFNKTVFSSILGIHLALILIVGVFWIFGVRTFFGLNIFPDLFLIIAIVYFQGTNTVTLNMLRVNENHKTYFKGRLYIQITKFFLVVLGVYLLNSYVGYLIGSVISAIIANLIYTAGSRKTAHRESFDKTTFISLFGFSWPFIFHGLAGNLLGNADKFVLERFMTLNDVGLYTLAYSLGSSMIFAYVGISVFMEPMIYKEQVEEKRKVLLDKFLFFTLLLGLICYTALAIASQYILPQFYDVKYKQVFEYVPMIAISFLIYPFYLKSNYRMIYERKSLNIAIVSIGSALINIGLNVYLIPIYGIYAAVLTTLMSYIIQAIMFILISNKFKVNSEFADVLVIGSIAGVSVCFELSYFHVVILLSLFLSYLYFAKIRLKTIINS